MRSEFEQYWEKKHGGEPYKGWGYWRQVGGYRRDTDNLHEMWVIWKDSRAALVVDLPEPHAHLIWIQAGSGPDDYCDDVEVSRNKEDKCCDGSDRYRVYSEFEVSDMIRAAGITVKDNQ
uniref:Uncharacterized protein n=1 Tax=Pectobacterium phage Amona TaxID=3158137 RepID=A0AB39ABD2_9CAUD